MFISALNSLVGSKNTLGLPSASNACVVLVDGLGSHNLEHRAGHAPLLATQLKVDGSIHCGFPSTTVASLTSFSTGLSVGHHGMVGYQVFDRESGEKLNLLTGLKTQDQARHWQPKQTVSEVASDLGISCYFVGPPEYQNSGFTMATMPSAIYVVAKSIEDRFVEASRILNSGKKNLIYLYVPELDQRAHAFGAGSAQWVEKLEDLESGVRGLLRKLPKDSGVLITADHGVIDVDVSRHVYLDELFIEDLVSVGGDPRVLYLYFRQMPEQQTISKLKDFLGKRAYVATAAELVEAGWFGATEGFATDRLPEILLISVGETALYHREFAKPQSLKMIGQHGSVSDQELRVPLLKFGAFQVKR